jgi:predicted transcriptional regulator
MSAKDQLPRPTPGELEILRVLWQRGASSVRDVHDALSASRPTGYTTVLKLLQIMADKGLVTRDVSRRTHVYEAALAQDLTQRQLLDDLLDRV